MGFSGLVCWLILLMFPWSYTRSSRRNSAWRWQPSKLCQSRLVPEIMNTSKFITYWKAQLECSLAENLTCLTSTGFCRRHLTWYQWVSASVGAVDSQTVAPLPMNATSNQNAKPWTIPELFKHKSMNQNFLNHSGMNLFCNVAQHARFRILLANNYTLTCETRRESRAYAGLSHLLNQSQWRASVSWPCRSGCQRCRRSVDGSILS